MTGRTPQLARRGAVLAIFFLSGASGLIYQVSWVRQFGNVFGNTVFSASLVAGVFLAGLGAGAWVMGRAADRWVRIDPRSPLRTYALAELGVALLGLSLSLLIPRLAILSAATSTYVSGAHGWHELSFSSQALRYAVAVLLIAPPTFLMGGTLTVLTRALVGTTAEGASDGVAALYGVNTLGAATGALLTDLALVPALGILRTQWVAVGLNAAAGMAALALWATSNAPVDAGHESRAEESSRANDRTATWLTAAALGLGGFAAIGFEILWFRFLSSALGERRAVFSLLLAVMLFGIGVGALFGSFLHRRFGRPALLLLAAECSLAITTLALLAFVDPHGHGLGRLRASFDSAPEWRRFLLELWASARPIAALVLLPAVIMGVSFPLANANVQRLATVVGAKAGTLYLWTCMGNVAGSVVVGFWLLPLLGMQTTALVLAICLVATTLPLVLSARPFATPYEARQAWVTVTVFGGASVIAVAGFGALPGDRLLRQSFSLDAPAGRRDVLEIAEGVNETLAVTEIPGFFRELLTNGHQMSSTHPKAQRYMRAFAHIPLLWSNRPTRALVICFGVGTTASAVLLHPSIERLDIADLSRSVLEHASWFVASNHDVLLDPRVSVFVNDGRQHLRMEKSETYDLITLEPPPISAAGVASLYSREFYELARSRLKASGYITQWLPAYEVREGDVRSAVRAFVDVFPQAVLLSGDDNELILMGSRGADVRLDLATVTRRIAESPAVAKDLERLQLGDLTDLAGTFAASRETMVRATADASPVTDDRPSLEYSVLSPLRDLRMPRDLFDLTDFDAWCPECLARLPGLVEYMSVRSAIYASDFFLMTSASGRAVAPFDLAHVRDGARILAAHPYLRSLLGGAALPAKEAALASLGKGRIEEAIDLFDLARYYDPGDADTYSQLGDLFAAIGRLDMALAARSAALRLRAGRSQAP